MPYYYPLKRFAKSERTRTINGIKRLREQLTKCCFPEKKDSTLILGTWNIRNFDDNRFGYGPRTKESLFYLAEIISRFDVLAVQEICDDLYPLKKLMDYLGNDFDYILTDVTHGSLGGNQERLGFIFDKRKVKFTGVAGEIVLPNEMLISDVEQKRQFSRTPFGAEFQAGWFKFYFSTVHIFFGSNSVSSPKYKRRVQEIQAVAQYLAKVAKKRDSNHILVGDFNIKSPGSKGFNALVEAGFTTVQNKKGSNKDQSKFYDQISFIAKKNQMGLVKSKAEDNVLQFFDSVYRIDDSAAYRKTIEKGIRKEVKEEEDKIKGYKKDITKAKDELKTATSATVKTKLNKRIDQRNKWIANRKKDIKDINAKISTIAKFEKYYDKWRTFQASDHLPLWVEIKIDYSDKYLEDILDD